MHQPPTPGRWARFQERYPALYASRHIALAILKAALPLLGLGALAAAALSWLDWSWLWELGAYMRAWLPDSVQRFMERPDPEPWFAGTRWFAWVKQSIRLAKWLLPIALAVAITIEEVRRHKRKQEHSNDANTP